LLISTQNFENLAQPLTLNQSFIEVPLYLLKKKK